MQRVYLFATCLIDSFYPHFGMDAANLLALCGYRVNVPAKQTCCGQPPYNSGYKDEAFPIAKQVIDTFSEDWPVIVPSASCAGMIKHHYPQLFAKNTPEYDKAKALSQRTYELVDFIVDKLPYDQVSTTQSTRIALHQSCSARREMAVSKQWYDILSRLEGVEIFEPQYAEECCGFGGTFAIRSSKISKAMTQDKCFHLANTQADIVVTGDGGCLMNLEQHYRFLEESASQTKQPSAATEQSGPIKVQHHAQFVAQRFGVAYEP